MQAVLTALEEQHSELAALLEPLDDTGWQLPTRCEGWTVADVVLHLTQTDELALASAQGQFAEGLDVLAGGLDRHGNVDDGAAAIVALERGLPNAELFERWRTGAVALTVIEGAGADLCLVAARRVAAEATSLRGAGPDAHAVLELVRTYA